MSETLVPRPAALDRRDQILAVARDVLLTEGYERTSMRNIAARLQVTPTTLYIYFRNKEDLVFHLMEDTMQILYQALEPAVDPAIPPLEGLRRALDAYIRFGQQHPDHYRVVFMSRSAARGAGKRMPESRPDSESLGEQAFHRLSRGVDRCIAAGLFRPLDAEAAAEMLWSGVHGLAALLVVMPQHLSTAPDVLIETLVETLIRGLAAAD